MRRHAKGRPKRLPRASDSGQPRFAMAAILPLVTARRHSFAGSPVDAGTAVGARAPLSHRPSFFLGSGILAAAAVLARSPAGSCAPLAAHLRLPKMIS